METGKEVRETLWEYFCTCVSQWKATRNITSALYHRTLLLPPLAPPSILCHIHREYGQHEAIRLSAWLTELSPSTVIDSQATATVRPIMSLTSSALHRSGLSSQPGQTLSRDWIMLEPPAPLSHLCPACKLWPCGEYVCVWMWVCGWPDCYIHFSGLLSLLVMLTCLFRDSKRKVACRLGKVKLSWGFLGVWLEVSQHSQSSVEVLPVCQRGTWSHIAIGQRGQTAVLSSSLYF